MKESTENGKIKRKNIKCEQKVKNKHTLKIQKINSIEKRGSKQRDRKTYKWEKHGDKETRTDRPNT